jgi:hypothetical protein
LVCEGATLEANAYVGEIITEIYMAAAPVHVVRSKQMMVADEVAALPLHCPVRCHTIDCNGCPSAMNLSRRTQCVVDGAAVHDVHN